ncbi:unnamed protein product [Schistosoma margrebowiei]|uniref:Uncharacterized protein n=1 Tax=Schistosoma margrebowiei TaxID=48269 RepID=A0A183LUX5_9TREM|nr:unnamed protein product [Schistosoma margrebowiei]
MHLLVVKNMFNAKHEYYMTSILNTIRMISYQLLFILIIKLLPIYTLVNVKNMF